MNSKDFQYTLPEEAIARHPVEPRRAARMAVMDAHGTLDHGTFEDLPRYMVDGGIDGVWANDTRVLHARLLATKPTGGQLEVFLLSPAELTMEEVLSSKEPVTWKAMIRNAKRWKDGKAHASGSHHDLEIIREDDAQDGHRVVRLSWGQAEQTSTFAEVLDDLGKTPLPPYMRRAAEDQDRLDYQTVFALTPGSVAAPTAGLHYDEVLLDSLASVGLPLNRLTLHVGAGTFKPLSEGAVMAHDMHAEQCVLTKEAIQTMATQVRRVATGTTTLRTMESMYWWALHWHVHGVWLDVLPQRCPYEELALHSEDWTDGMALEAILNHGPWNHQGQVSFETQLMIVPGYRIRMACGLVTNFHQPGSTLLCLVAAFVGMDKWKPMYETCLDAGYRFLSYGDGSLLWLQHQD
ncbi:MAG: S-adenosylmethionine:tRNA ribosyltransferase-isomerase [Flavobacteriales bacterium]